MNRKISTSEYADISEGLNECCISNELQFQADSKNKILVTFQSQPLF